ncbi:TPA: helix-turn-helix domain-containing protein [Providencia rettgeri]|uniref:helix-turn-helix domain-containing protein n=1 Tax=Providencia vermicola TaxID=333965 RepID=UPI0032DB86C4
MKVNNNLRINIGDFIRKARKDKSLTAKELGNLVGVSQQQISRYELGITSMNFETLEVFIYVLDESWESFFHNVIDDYEVNSLRDNLYNL